MNGFVNNEHVDDAVAEENKTFKCTLASWPGWKDGPGKRTISGVNFLSTCRQLYSEGERLLYGCNAFCFHSLEDLGRFTMGRTLDQLEQVRSISLFHNVWPDDDYERYGLPDWDPVAT